MKRRIALISEHASPIACLGGIDSGGQNVYVSEIARHITSCGYEVDIITRWDDAELPQVINWWAGARIIHVAAGPRHPVEKELLLPYMQEFFDSFQQFVDDHDLRYALIHANFWMSGWVAQKFKQARGVPFVITFHALGYVRKLYQNGSDRFPAERIDIERSVIAEASRIIAECPQDRLDLLSYYGARDERITVIPCGFNPNEFFPVDQLLARRTVGLPKDVKIILQLGRLVPRKGIDNVIMSLAHLSKSRNDVRLVIVGGEHEDPERNHADPEVQRLWSIAQEQGVSSQVIFVGRRNREMLRYYYSAANVFVTTPWYEPFGITPIEAMACGVPVVGACVGGIKYSIEDGKTGFLVDPKRPEELAWKLELMLRSEEMRAAMGKEGANRAHRLFTWALIADQLKVVYEEVIAGAVHPSESRRHLRAWVNRSLMQACNTFERAAGALTSCVVDAGEAMVRALKSGNKILVCGNGGSAAESQHFVAELLGRFEIPFRRALPALSLTADTSFLTAWSNDRSFEEVFSRQVEAYGSAGDILVCFSTSGNSPNVLRALSAAKERDMITIAITGKGGGLLADEASINVIAPSRDTQRIQELHLHIIHSLCAIVEMHLADTPSTDQEAVVEVPLRRRQLLDNGVKM